MKSLSRIFTITAAALMLTACSDPAETNNGQQRVREVVVQTKMVESRPFEELVRVTGTIEAIDDATISAEVPGRVIEILDRGAKVEKGDILVKLDDRVVRSSLEMARANYELAEDALRRQEPLLRDSIISELAFNQIRTQRDQARLQLEQAQKMKSDSQIEAPFAGTVERRMVNVGELVNPGFPVLRLVNTQRVRINAGVPERYINDIRNGTPVRVDLSAYGGGHIETRVRFSGSVIAPETRTFPVELVIDNRRGLLKPEMVVSLGLIRKVWPDALVVPRTALVRDEDGFQLYVVRNEGENRFAEVRRVKTGSSSGALIIIEDGLDPGDEVIVTGQTNVSDGDRVRILPAR